MIFQQPTSALNPVMNVGDQIGEVLEIHRRMNEKAARDRAIELMQMVGIPDPGAAAQDLSPTRCPAAWRSA